MNLDITCNVCGSYTKPTRTIKQIQYNNNTIEQIEIIRCPECKTLRYSKQTPLKE